MEVHRIKTELLARLGNAPEQSIDKFETELEVSEPQKLSKVLTKQITGPESYIFSLIENLDISYILIKAEYIEDSLSDGIKKGDKAPFRIRFNDTNLNLLEVQGLFLWFGNPNYLQAYNYGNLDIKIEVYVG